jgi:hypothetical protein
MVCVSPRPALRRLEEARDMAHGFSKSSATIWLRHSAPPGSAPAPSWQPHEKLGEVKTERLLQD